MTGDDYDPGGAASGFLAALFDGVRPRDLLGLVTVPVLLVAVYALPEATRRELTFRFAEPTLVTAYTAHFVHFAPEHLLVNVVGYVLLAGVGYVLAVLAGRRELFGVGVATFLLAFPVVLSALNLGIRRDAVSYGFSGVNMALLGVLPLLLAEYAGRNLHPAVDVRHAPSLFFAAFVPVTLVALPRTRLSGGVAVAAGLVAASYGWSLRRSHRETKQHGGLPRPRTDGVGWLDLFLVGLLLFSGFLFVGFPPSTTLEAGRLNTYVHLLGFSLAFIGLYVVLELGLFGDVSPAAGDG